MDDTYVYISVKLSLNSGQTEDSIQDIIMNMDYSFEHDEIIEHEIIDILDHQIPEESKTALSSYRDMAQIMYEDSGIIESLGPKDYTEVVDPFDLGNLGDWNEDEEGS